MVQIGEQVEDFLTEAYHEDKVKKIKLSDYKGKWVIMLFYPADFTFVCPTELEEAADMYEQFKKEEAEILSVSTDTVFVHKAWHDHSKAIAKIKYPMLADPSGRICKQFGTYIENEGLSLTSLIAFWEKLKKAKRGGPILALAPMADVTDVAFRRIIAKYGKPDVLWTEFVSCDGLFLSTPEGKKKLMRDLDFSKAERPIVVQLFSSKPEMMERGAKLAAELGFDGIDINMGCPDRSIEKQGAGAVLMKNPKLAKELPPFPPRQN
jgi:peroxiredoxin